MQRKGFSVVLAFTLLLDAFLSSACPTLASGGGGDQVFYPVVDSVSEIVLIDNNLWTAMNGWDSPLIWSNVETGRWVPQNRSAGSVDAYDQDLWVVDGRVSLFDGTSWTEWSTWTAQAIGPSVQIQADDTGHPWFLSESAVSRYNGSDWERLVAGPEYPHWANYKQIVPVSADEAWVAYYGGLLHVVGTVTETFTMADGLVSNNMVTVAYDAVNNEVWAGSENAGISHGDGTSWISVTTSDGLQSNQIRALDVGNGSTWVAYKDIPGVIAQYTAGSGVSHINLPGEFASNLVTYIHVQTPATLWVGLDNSTILRYVSDQWSIVTTINGPASYTVNRVFGVADSVYTNGWQGTSWFRDSTWQKIPDGFTTGVKLGPNNYWLGRTGYLGHSSDGHAWQVTDLGSNVRVTRIASDTQSSFLYLGTDSGLWQYDPATKSVVNKWYPATEASAPGDYIKDLQVVADGSVWLIASVYDGAGAITYFNPATSTWTKYYSDKLATGMAQTSAGELWFSISSSWSPFEYGSLINFDGAAWSVYTQTHGLPWHMVTDVAVDAADRVWTMGHAFGTAANNYHYWSGFSVWDGTEFTSYHTAPGLSTYNAEMWIDRETGDLWAPTSSPSGVLRFNPNGVTATEEILATETVIKSADNSGQAVFPPGALPAGTVVNLVTTLAENDGNLKGLSSVLEVNWSAQASQLQAAGTYTITLNYVAPTLGIVIPDSLGLYSWNSGSSSWEGVDSTVHDSGRMEFSATVSDPGRFQIMGMRYDVYLPLTLRQ